MYEYVIGFTAFCVFTVMGDEILQDPFQKLTDNQAYSAGPPSPVLGNNVSLPDSYRKFDIPQDQKPVTCVNTQLLISILNNLLKILSDGKESLSPNVIDQINKELDLMQKFINKMPNGSVNAELLEKFKHLQENFNNESDVFVKPQEGNMKSEVVLKYEMPGVDQLKCRQALIKLMEIANTAYMNILNHPVCQGSGISAQNKQLINGNYVQNEVKYIGFQPQIPINNHGLVSSNQQYQTNIYGQLDANSNVRPFYLNSASNMKFQQNQPANSAFPQNNLNSQSSQSSSIVHSNLNSKLLIQPLEPPHPFIQLTNYLQKAAAPNPGYQSYNSFKEQPSIIYGSSTLQTPIETNSPYLNPNNNFNPLIQLPNTYPTTFHSAHYESTVAGSSYNSYNSFPNSPLTIKPTRPSFVDQEKTNFNSITYSSNEDEFTNNLQHAKYVAESMAQAINALHASDNFPGNDKKVMNSNNMLPNNANQLMVPLSGQFPTNEEFLALKPLESYQNNYPSHAELLNVHYQKIPLRQTANKAEDLRSDLSPDGKIDPVLNRYVNSQKRNNPVEQRDGLRDENVAQYLSEWSNDGFNRPPSPSRLTELFDGNKLPTSLPQSDSDPHLSTNPIIQNTATFNINNNVLNLTSTAIQNQDPRSNHINNKFQNEVFSKYPNSLASIPAQTDQNGSFGDNNIYQYKNPNFNPINDPNTNYFEKNFPNLHEQLQNLNKLQNQLPHSSQFKNQNPGLNSIRFPNSPNKQVQFQNMINIPMTPPSLNPNQMQNFNNLQNKYQNMVSNQMPNENSNQDENQFLNPNLIQEQNSYLDHGSHNNQIQNPQTPSPNLHDSNLKLSRPSHSEPPYNPYSHNANNYFNIAHQNGQFHNVQQFNAPPSQPSHYSQYLSQYKHYLSLDQEKQNASSGYQRLFDSTTNNVQNNNNFIISPSITSKPASMDLQPPVNPPSIDQQLHINDQRTSFINKQQPGFNTIPNNIQSNYYDGGVSIKPNLEQWFGVTNLYKLNYEPNKSGLIELTYLLQRPNPMLYQPFYVVKYSVPYLTYLSHLRQSLQNRPYLRSDPAQLYNELIPKSNITEVSPDLRDYDEDSLKKWVIRSGSLYKAKIVNKNLTSVDDHVKMVHDMSSDMPQGDFVKVLDEMIKDNNITDTNEFSNQSTEYSVKPIEESFKESGMPKPNLDTNANVKENKVNQTINPRRFMLPPSYRRGQNSRQEAPKNFEGAPYNYQVPQKKVVPQKYPPVENNPLSNHYPPIQNHQDHSYPSIQNYPLTNKPLHQNYPPPQNYPPQNYSPLQNYPPPQNYSPPQNYPPLPPLPIH